MTIKVKVIPSTKYISIGDSESFSARIVSIQLLDKDVVEFSELCDGYFTTRCTKAEAIRALETIVTNLKNFK